MIRLLDQGLLALRFGSETTFYLIIFDSMRTSVNFTACENLIEVRYDGYYILTYLTIFKS